MTSNSRDNYSLRILYLMLALWWLEAKAFPVIQFLVGHAGIYEVARSSAGLVIDPSPFVIHRIHTNILSVGKVENNLG